MRKFLFPFTLVLLIAAITALPAGAITWGEPDTTHPNVGAMVVDWPDYGPWQWCSGALIHPRVFLTAGHCTDGLEEYGIQRVWVNFDVYAVNEATLLDVERIVTHPDYAWEADDIHDVGLLILAEPIYDIPLVPLPTLGFLDDLREAGLLRTRTVGAKFTNVGYGGSLSWPPHEIFYEDLRQVSVSEYIAHTKTMLHLSQNLLKDDSGTCYGDSGGPTLYPVHDDAGQLVSEIVVAVVSTGDGACMTTGRNYRIDIPTSLDFIYATLAEVDASGN